jgi:predicted Zn-dependent peptidase
VIEGVVLLAEVLRRPRLVDLKTEKQIIREEILEDLNEDGEQIDVDNVSRELLYPSHPLGFSIPGPLDNLRRFETNDLREHHTTHYTARNSVICLAGAFEAGEVAEAIHSSFDALVPGNAVEPQRAPVQRAPSRFAFVYDHGSQTDVRLSFHVPGLKSPEAPVLMMLSRVMDDGLSTRVHQRICEERGLAYDAFAGNDSFEECGVFDLGASVEHQKTPTLVEAFLELVDELRSKPPSALEVDKAKDRYLWALRTVRDDPEDTVDFVGSSALFGLPEWLQVIAEQVSRVTPEDIRRAACRYLDPKDAYLTCVGALDDHVLADVRSLIGD